VNAVGDVRWNTAFAYLDPARARTNLTIIPDALVDRLRFEGDRAVGTIIRVEGDELEIGAGLVVLAAARTGLPRSSFGAASGPPKNSCRSGSASGRISRGSGGTSSTTPGSR
jgi:choline dehydrogenase